MNRCSPCHTVSKWWPEEFAVSDGVLLQPIGSVTAER